MKTQNVWINHIFCKTYLLFLDFSQLIFYDHCTRGCEKQPITSVWPNQYQQQNYVRTLTSTHCTHTET